MFLLTENNQNKSVIHADDVEVFKYVTWAGLFELRTFKHQLDHQI